MAVMSSVSQHLHSERGADDGERVEWGFCSEGAAACRLKEHRFSTSILSKQSEKKTKAQRRSSLEAEM